MSPLASSSYEVLPRVQYPTGGGSLAWRADSKGFWYTRYPGTERPDGGTAIFHMAVYFHRAGKESRQDAYVFGKDLPKIAEISLSNRYNPSATCWPRGQRRRRRIRPLPDRSGTIMSRQITHFADHVVAATAGADGTHVPGLA